MVRAVAAGTVTLGRERDGSQYLGAHRKSKKAILTLASGSFVVAGGQVKAVSLHLSAKARTLLAHVHVLRASATLIAHDSSGATHTTTSIVTLRVAPVHKKKHWIRGALPQPVVTC